MKMRKGHVIRKNDRLCAWIELNGGCDRQCARALHMGILCRRLVVEYCIWWPVFITNAYYKWHTVGAEGGGKLLLRNAIYFYGTKSKWCLAVDGKATVNSDWMRPNLDQSLSIRTIKQLTK